MLWAIIVLVAALFVRSCSWSPTPDESDKPNSTASVASTLEILPDTTFGQEKLMLPYFEEARGCTWRPLVCRFGIEPDDRGDKVVRLLKTALTNCGGPMRVSVSGFASSSDFHGEHDPDLNRQVANLRAKMVTDLLTAAPPLPENVIVVAVEWDTPNQMFLARRFLDHLPKWDSAKASLGRRVDLTVEAGSKCSVADLVKVLE